jgi:hypothetical protein
LGLDIKISWDDPPLSRQAVVNKYQVSTIPCERCDRVNTILTLNSTASRLYSIFFQVAVVHVCPYSPLTHSQKGCQGKVCIIKKAAKQKSVSSKRLPSKSLYRQNGCQAKACIIKKAAKQKSVSSKRLPSKSLYRQKGCQAKVCIVKMAAKQKSISSKRLLFGHPILVFLDSSVLRNSTTYNICS